MKPIFAIFVAAACVNLFTALLFLVYEFEEHLQNSSEQTAKKLEDIERKLIQLKAYWEDKE